MANCIYNTIAYLNSKKLENYSRTKKKCLVGFARGKIICQTVVIIVESSKLNIELNFILRQVGSCGMNISAFAPVWNLATKRKIR